MTATTDTAWHALPADDVARDLGTDLTEGLTDAGVRRSRAEHGPNTLTRDEQASVWQVALSQFRDPMTEMQVPQARVIRNGSLIQIDAADMVVAMTGDAVNDAAALKQADIGVAMGSGSEVTKQAARMVLTDDNFATLVHAISLGRGIYSRITSYIGYQMTQLFGLVSMFLIATAFNINEGVAMLPLQVLFLNFVIAVIPVIIISTDPLDPAVMTLPPRDPKARIMDRVSGPRWIILGILLGVLCITAILVAPGPSAIDTASTPITMGFIVMGLGTALAGFTMHRTPGASFAAPLLRPLGLSLLAVFIMLLTTEMGFLQRWLDTVPLTGGQWLVCAGLALVFATVVELDKVWQRRRAVAQR